MKGIISSEIIDAYLKRLQKMQELKFSKEGDDLFIVKLVAESEQVQNLHVRARVNDFQIDCDEPKNLGGSNLAPNPMQMLLAAFANCLEISALLYFSFARVKLNSVKVKVEALVDRRAVLPDKEAPLPGFYDIKCTWFIDTNENLKKIEKVLQKVEQNCPVKGTFSRTHSFSQKIILLKNEHKKE